MYERILIPLDGSEIGESALQFMKDLLSKLSKDVVVEVTLLHILSPYSQSVSIRDESFEVYYQKEDYENIKIKFMEYLNATGETQRSAGIKVNVRVEFGDIPNQIVRVAEEVHADMIAMSSHGRSGVELSPIGSVAYKVLQLDTDIPIIVVRPPKRRL
ncbi:MAG TPA: universal stress protein [Dehalococcoidales bacterium]|nr:universal stress protein [Dehalococcoidales bacterium]